MGTNEKWLFIINPNAGRKRGLDVQGLIRNVVGDKVPYEIRVWEDAADFEPVADRITGSGCTHVVAVGGDGTVNRVSAGLSGNGNSAGSEACTGGCEEMTAFHWSLLQFEGYRALRRPR